MNDLDDGKKRNGKRSIDSNAHLEEGISLQEILNLGEEFSAEVASEGEAKHEDANDGRDSIGRVAEDQGQETAPNDFINEPAKAGKKENRYHDRKSSSIGGDLYRRREEGGRVWRAFL